MSEPVSYYARIKGFDECLVAHTTRSKARYRVYLAMADAGFNPTFQEIKLKRAHHYDVIADRLHKQGKCIGIAYADRMCDTEPARGSLC